MFGGVGGGAGIGKCGGVGVCGGGHTPVSVCEMEILVSFLRCGVWENVAMWGCLERDRNAPHLYTREDMY